MKLWTCPSPKHLHTSYVLEFVSEGVVNEFRKKENAGFLEFSPCPKMLSIELSGLSIQSHVEWSTPNQTTKLQTETLQRI